MPPLFYGIFVNLLEKEKKDPRTMKHTLSMALSPPNNLTTRKQHILNKQSLSSSTSVDDNVAILTPESESKCRRIWFSDVVVKRSKRVFVKRKWSSSDVKRLSMMIVVHGLAMFGPFTFSWPVFWVAFVLYYMTGLFGITLSFHRNLAHSSLRLPKWLEYLFAYFGSLALQGDPITWVSAHRLHHKFVDSKQDPHSPLEGFWFSHINWIFDTKSVTEKRGELAIAEDLTKQTFYQLMRRTYLLHSLALALLLYAFGGFSYVVWGMGVRTTIVFHITFSVNSICHVWGYQAWNTGDLSKNNWLIGLFTGEAWHNNHHAFEYSARHGLEWWQIDLTWYVIRLLEALGLAKDVKLPSEGHKQRLAFKSEK